MLLSPEISEKVEEINECNPTRASGFMRTTGLNIYISYLKYVKLGADALNDHKIWVEKTLESHVASKFVQFYNTNGQLCEYRILGAFPERPINPITKSKIFYPSTALRRNLTYESMVYGRGAMISVDTAEILDIVPTRSHICSMPVPVLSSTCHLSLLKTPQELMRVGHDPDDPGTWYVISGNKMIMPHIEKLRFYQIHIFPPKKKEKYYHARQVFLTSSGTTMMKVVLVSDVGECVLESTALGKPNGSESKKIYTTNNSINVISVAYLIDYYYKTKEGERPMSELIPIHIIFLDAVKCFLPISDDPVKWNHINVSFQATLAVYLRSSKENILNDLITWLGAKELDNEKRAKAITTFIDRNIFPTATEKRAKIYMLANLTARILAHDAGVIKTTNLNKWGFRKLDTSPVEMARRLRHGMTHAMKKLQDELGEPNPNKAYSLSEVDTLFSTFKSVVSEQIISSFKPVKPNQTSKFQTTERVDVLNLGHLWSLVNKIHVNVYKKTKSMELRNVQYTQYGYVCPEHTPDNEQCGLVKFKTPSSRITSDINPSIMIEKLISLGIIKRTFSEENRYPVIVNGIPVGFCTGKQAQIEISLMRRRKRYDNGPEALLHDHICVVFDEYELMQLEIYTDDGRLVRPVLYVENGKLLAETHGLIDKPFEVLLEQGCAGWIDAYEEEFSMVSASIKDLYTDTDKYQDYINKYNKLIIENPEDELMKQILENEIKRFHDWPIKYCTLHPVSQFDVSVSFLPFIENEQPCRVTYGNKMSNQAMTLNPLSAKHESGRYLDDPHQPLVDTALSSVFGLTNQPLGKNKLGILMSTKDTQEDAITLSRSAADDFRYTRSFIKTGKLKPSKEADLKFGLPDLTNNPEKDKFGGLASNGYPVIGRYYREKDKIIGMTYRSPNGNLIDKSITLDKDEQGYVVDIIHTPASGASGIESISVILEDYRETEVGDKFSTRHGQKFTLGSIVKDTDMPFIMDGPYKGRRPDYILNPHCIGSRMTAGVLLEMLLGRAIIIDTVYYEGTAFENKEDIIDTIRRILTMHGQIGSGVVELINGETGEMMQGEAFFGPMFIMKLCHLAREKLQGTFERIKDNVGQAKKGRKGGGAVRFGNQEIWAALAHMSTMFALQRTSTYSDAIKITVCMTCGVYNWNIYSEKCRNCGSEAGFAVRTINRALYTLSNMLLSAGTKIKPVGVTEEEYIRKLRKKVTDQFEEENTEIDYLSENEVDENIDIVEETERKILEKDIGEEYDDEGYLEDF